MNIVCFSDINGACHTGNGEPQGYGLCLPQLSPGTLTGFPYRLHKIGQLNEKKRKIPLGPSRTPIQNHILKGLAVLRCPAGIRLTLIPDHPPDTCIQRCIDHPIEQQGRHAVRSEAELRRTLTNPVIPLSRQIGAASSVFQVEVLRLTPYTPAATGILYPDHNQVGSSPECAGRQAVSPLLIIPADGFPDLLSVDPNDIGIVDGAEMQDHRTHFHFGTAFHSAGKPHNAIEALQTCIFPQHRQFHGRPIAAVIIRIGPDGHTL